MAITTQSPRPSGRLRLPAKRWSNQSNHINALVAAACLLLGGCGPTPPALWPVSGKIVFTDGTPVTWGVIEFASDQGGPVARGTIDADGRFTLTTGTRPGAVAGRHQIAIVQVVMTDGAPDVRPQHESRLVDSRYNSFTTAKLEREIEPDKENRLEIEVKSAMAKRR